MRIADSVVLTDTEYGAVLLEQRTGEYFNLNMTGTIVLRMLVEGEEVPAIVQRLGEEYSVTLEEAREDVDALLTELHDAGLVRP